VVTREVIEILGYGTMTLELISERLLEEMEK